MQSFQNMLGFDKESVNVVEPTIGGFCDQWTGPALKDPAVLHLPPDDRIADNANAMSICNSNWTFQEAAFLHPGRAGHFAVAVEREPGGKDGIMVLLSTRVDNGHSCPC